MPIILLKRRKAFILLPLQAIPGIPPLPERQAHDRSCASAQQRIIMLTKYKLFAIAIDFHEKILYDCIKLIIQKKEGIAYDVEF